MAVKRRRTTTAKRRRTSPRRTYKRRTKKRKTLKVKVNPTVATEIWAIIYMAIGVLTILSLKGTFGIVGDMWVNMLKPILGWGVYIIPGIFLLVSVLMFFSKKLHFGATKTLGFVFFMISILSIFHLSVPIDQIMEYAARGTYGGYTGFVTNFLLLEVLKIGPIGAAIIFISLFLVSMLLIFEIPLRELFSFVVPEIKIEMSKEDNKKLKSKKGESRKHKDLEVDKNDAMPEIMIHKARIEDNKKKADAVIYEEDEENESESEQKKVTDLKINQDEENQVSESLSEGAKKASMSTSIDWEFPSLDLLDVGDSNVHVDEAVLMQKADKIKKKLAQFGINVVMHEVNVGPTVIQFTLKPHEGIKLSKITSLKNDLALVLAAERIRIEAPIPGKALVGIEVPNDYRAVVHLREMLESAIFTDAKSKLTLPLGRDVAGKPIIANLETMPHLLIAGATGSGKSICMNTFLISLLYQNSPQDLNFIMIDPKRVELSSYNNIPHLLTPVIQDPEKAAISLRWVVAEMTRRYSDLSDKRVRNVFEYNELNNVEKMSRIIVVVDELADLMMAAGKEVEASICRIAQMARAVGIHLIIATQRPSVDVITGLIKANIPSRIAFAVSSSIDSRTILDGIGAEDLLGRGDMLYLPTGQNKPTRIQGVYVSTNEIEKITNRVKLTVEPEYDNTIISNETANKKLVGIPDSKAGSDEDSKYEDAYNLVRETKKASASLLQRRLKVGYARAARLIDLLEENGVVGPSQGAKARKILID
ncbi:cell division protein FtsK [Candidatus Peregrinibacteria bacterium]|nr:cell division protein FtsK [Candidatus Peregrinibacteria bacterium]